MMSNSTFVFASDFAPIRKFAPLMAENPGAIYGDLLELIQSADYRVVNLESPLDPGNGLITKSGAAFTGMPEHISALKTAGFNGVIMANNHTFDSGVEGFRATRKLLTGNGIAFAGAGENQEEAERPLVINLNGTRIALFAISEGEDMLGATPNRAGVAPWNPEALARKIRAARETYDLIFVSAHCGLEYQPYPSFYVYEAFRLWAESGADLIIGHHPHVPQGKCCFNGVPCYFSLGNFVFYQPAQLFYRKIGYFLQVEISDKKIVDCRSVPYQIGENGLSLLKNQDKQEFESLFEKLSAPLQNEESARRAWHAVLAVYGEEGFRSELEKILAEMKETPAKGAAMLRNRLSCMQHYTQWIDGMSRIIDGTISDAPEEEKAMVREYLTRSVTP